MRNRGLSFGAAVIVGVLLAHTVLPVRRGPAAVAVAVAALATVGTGGTWWLVPAGLGVLRSAVSRERAVERMPTGPWRGAGRVSVMGEAGRNVVVQVGPLRAVVADTTRVLPRPGHDAWTTLRLDPLRSRAERSAFRADRWARARDYHARGRILGDVREVRPTPGARGALRRVAHGIRERARRRLGFGDSPARSLITALVIGDRTALEAHTLDEFRRAGLAHVLALSGMHVGVLALGFGSLLRSLRVPAAGVVAATLLFLAGFALITGGAAPILRASGTSGLALLAGALHRRGPPGHALGLVAGALLLLRPALLFDAGFRLSFLAAGTLALWSACAPRPRPGWRGSAIGLADGLAMSACVTLATAPEIVSSFGAVSLLSPLTNLLAGLPATLALGWGALAAWLPATRPLADAAGTAAGALLAVARHAAPLPGGGLVLPAPGPAASLAVLVAATAFARRRRPRGRELVAVAGLVALVAAASRPRDRLTFVDVGQGDAALLEAGGRTVLVDAGPGGWEDREAAAVPALRSRRMRAVDALVLTHGHLDHTGGAETLLRAGDVRRLVIRAEPRSDALQELARVADAAGVPVGWPRGELAVGRIRVASPWPGPVPEDVSENDRSLMVRWRCGRRRALLLGDGGHRTEAAWLAAAADSGVPTDSLRSHVMAVPHHGSRESTGEALLAVVRPALAVVSCATGNPHGHPHRETLERLAAAATAVLRTDRDGTVTLTASPAGFRVRWERDFPGPLALLPAFPLSGSRRFP